MKAYYPLYLRDLIPDLQAQYLAEINRNPELKKALAEEKDIEIGRVYAYKKLRIA